MTQIKSWFNQNQALALFLIAQAVALGTAAAAILAYSVRLETRVSIMETRGAEYTVDRMQKMFDRLTVLEKLGEENKARLDRITDLYLKDMQQQIQQQQRRPPQ